MMNKFTAGPWKVGSKFEVGKVSDADDQSFGMIDPLADVYGDNKEADAKLIAAAPDLLEALQMAREMLNRNLPTLDRNVGFCPNIVSATVAAIGVVDIAIAKALA